MVRAAAALIACLSLSACAGLEGPSRTTTDYAHKAANTAEAISSSVSTAVLAVQLSDKGRLTEAILTVTLREAYDDASATLDGFDAVQPPDTEADAVQGQLDDISQGAVTSIRNALVHARRSQPLKEWLPALQASKDALDGFDPGHGA